MNKICTRHFWLSVLCIVWFGFQNVETYAQFSITNLNYTVAGNIYEFSFDILGGVGPYTITGPYLPGSPWPVSGNSFSFYLPCFLSGTYTVTDSLGATAMVNIISPAGCSPSNNANWCATASPIACDTILVGTTIGETNDISQYFGPGTSGCMPLGSAVFSGPDKIYQLTKTETGNLSIGLQIISPIPGMDLDLILVNSNCSVINCVAISGSNQSINNLEGIFVPNLANGTYYIIVDSNQPYQASDFILDVSCGTLNCNNIQPISCDVTYNGYSTQFGENGASIYLCGSNNQNVNNSGTEVIYSITTETQGDIEIVLTNLSANLELFILEDVCNVQNCIGQSFNPGLANESVFIPNAAPGTYYIVVDGFNGANGFFSLTANANCPQPPPPNDCLDNPLDWEWLQDLIAQTNCSGTCNLVVTQYYWMELLVVDVLFEGECFPELPPNPEENPNIFYSTSLSDGNVIIVEFGLVAGALTFMGGGFPVGGANHSVFDCDGNLLFPWGGGLNQGLADMLELPVELYNCDPSGCEIPGPTLPQTTICSGSSVSLNIGPGYTSYLWNNGATTQTISVSPYATTTYTVTVTDSNGCTGIGSGTVHVIPDPTLTISGSLSVCNGSSTTLLATSSFPSSSYIWSTGATTQTISVSPSATTTYTVTVTNSYGCIGIGSGTVHVIPYPTPTISGSLSVCNGSSTTLLATSGFPSYIWSTGATAQSILVNTPGTYVVTVTDVNGCTGSTSTMVSVGLIDPISIFSPTVVCSGNNALLMVLGGNPAYSYLWNTGETTPNIVVNPTNPINEYSVTATGSGGCTSSASVVIFVDDGPILQVESVTDASCGLNNGSISVSVSGGAAPYVYSWSHNPGLNSPTATGLVAGVYSVTVTNTFECSASINSIFIGDSTLSLSVTNIVSDNCYSSTGSISVLATDGAAPYTYSWSHNTGLNSPTATGLFIGTYTVTVTDANNCTAVQTGTVIGTTIPTIYTISSSDTSCGNNNGSITVATVGGTGPFYYTWSHNPGLNSPNATALLAGTYYVTVSDANGCTATTTAAIVNIAGPAIDSIIPTDATCGINNGTIDVSISGGTAPFNYSWSHNPWLDSPIATTLSAGTYTVTVWDANGCYHSASATVNVSGSFVIESDVQQPTCAGSSLGSISIVPWGGTPPFEYEWFPNVSDGNIAENMTGGTYFVTVTDAEGCSINEEFILSNTNSLDAFMSSNNPICLNGSDGTTTMIINNGIPPYSYQWSPNTTFYNNNTAYNLQAGTYTVTATDITGCSVVLSTTLVNPELLSAEVLTSNVNCFGSSSGIATAIVTGGTPPYTYNWSNGQTGDVISGLVTGSYTLTVTDFGNCETVISFIISEPSPISVSVSGNNPSCAGINNGSALATVFGGIPPFNYIWNNGQTGNFIAGLSEGIYTVTITDQNNCTTSSSVVLTAVSGIVLSSTTTSITCFNSNDGGIIITPSGGTTPYSYNWLPNVSTINSAFGLSAGIYSVTVTDILGCSASTEVTLNLPLPFSVSLIPQNILCNGAATGQLNSSITGGLQPFTYNWSNGANTPNATGLTVGTYTLIVTDANGCTAESSETLTEPSAIFIDADPTAATCHDEPNGSISITVSGGTAPYSYLWSNGSTGTFLPNLLSGNYTVTVTDANGCTISNSIFVGQPLLPCTTQVIDEEPSCIGGATGFVSVNSVGGTPPYTYLWSNGQTGNTATNLSGGTYFVTITDGNACTTSKSIDVEEYDAYPDLEITGILSICEGSTTVLSVGDTFIDYLWSNGATTSEISVSEAGDYSLTVTDAIGCIGTDTSTVTLSLGISVEVEATEVSCFGGNNGNIALMVTDGTFPYNYTWLPAISTGNTATNLVAGNYSVTVTDALGCSSSVDIIIVEPAPFAANLIAQDILCFGAATGQLTSIISGGVLPFTYLWSNGQTNPIATGLTAGTYTLTVTDANNCSAIATATLTEPAEIIITAFPVAATCYDVPNGSISISVSGGIPSYSYSWSNGSTGTFLPDLYSGTYTVTVTDANGCTLTQDIHVGQPSACSTGVISETPSCSGGATGSVTISSSGGTPPYTYLWSNGQTGNTANNLSGGIYYVTITDGNDCTTSKSIVVEENEAYPDLEITGNTSICEGSTTVLSIDDTFTDYLWSNNSTTSEITVSTIGVYSVTVSDALGCTGYAVDTVDLALNLIANAVTTTPEICEGSNIELLGSGGEIYLWTGPDGFTSNESNPIILNASIENAGTYTLIVTGAGDCESDPASISITVHPAPVLELTDPGIICGDEVLDLNTLLNESTPGGLWAGSGVFGNFFFAEEVGPGSYQIGYQLPDDGICSDFSTEISVSVAQPLLVGSHYCVPTTGGYQVYFDTWGGAPPYLIDNSTVITEEGGTFSSNVLSTPTYSFLITDSNGCTRFVIGENNSCNIDCATPSTGIISPIDDGLCNNGFSIFLTSGPPAPYTFSIDGENWQGSDIFTNLSPGTYYVQVQHSCGISILGTYTATNTLLHADIELTQNSEGEDIALVTVNTGTPPYQYLWSSIGLAGPEWVNPILPVTVIVEDALGCETSLSLYPVGINDASSNPTSIRIYPNPSTGIVWLDSDIKEPGIITVIDAMGRTVIQQETEFMNTVKLDLSEKGKGLYVISIASVNSKFTRKIFLY